MTLTVKDKAPKFTLPNQDGDKIRLADYKDKWVLIYFYPRDNTPGCTKETRGMQAQLKAFNKINLDVIGISADTVASHKKFADKLELQFNLLADEEQIVSNDYGVWGEKQFMGKKYMGITRSSFLIDPKGKIAKIYPKVKPEPHALEVLEDVKALIK